MRRHSFLPLIVLALVLLPPGAAVAAPAAIQVQVLPNATLVDGSIELSVRVKCAPFGEHFESNVTVTQDDQSIFAQRGLPVITCDRRWHTYTVLATPFDGSFHRGTARVSAFVSRMDPVTGEIRQGSAIRFVRVR